jgi:hypothetical protein
MSDNSKIINKPLGQDVAQTDQSYKKNYGKIDWSVGSPSSEIANDDVRGRRAGDLYIQDEMAPTKHPMDGKYYTSQKKFRETTKAFGMVEVGDAYDRGYDPSVERKRETEKVINRQWNEFVERVYKNGPRNRRE